MNHDCKIVSMILGFLSKKKFGGLPNFVLVDCGDCFFVLKVWNDQNDGAIAVQVADDINESMVGIVVARLLMILGFLSRNNESTILMNGIIKFLT